jgi:imidazolonepropionase-like amidohydrolase
MNLLPSLLLCAFALAPTAAQAGRELRSQVLIAGKPAGEQIARYGDDGTVEVEFRFADRGRGPDLRGRYRVGDDGLLEAATITGVAYLKTPVDERYERTGGIATWRSGDQAGRAEPEAPAQYLALDGTPEELAMLARALLEAPARTLALLPAGQARLELLGEQTVDGQALRLVAVHGLDLSPSLFWIDADDHFHASVSPWFSLVRDAAVDQVPELQAAQQAIQAEASAARAQRLAAPLAGATLVRDARAFDPDTGAMVGDSVLIRDGRIAQVGTGLAPPDGAAVIDAGGRFLMPGLWDMHVHLAGDADGLLHLAHGVTTVRDLANDNDLLARRSADFEAGRDLGPRIIKAGFLDGSGPFAGPSKALADDEATVREWIDRYAEQGYSQVKLYSSLRRDLVAGAIAYAHEKGLRVSGHVPMGMTARQFVELGADELQHANFLFLNFLAGADDDTRTPLRFSLVGQRGPGLDLSGAPVRAFVELLRQRGTVVDPTLVAFEDMFTSQPGHPALTYAPVLHRLPATWQRSLAAGGGGLPAADAAAAMRHRLAYERMIALVGELHRSGVAIVAGTDATAGLTYARELELYVQAGIPPAQVLRIATVNAAEAMKIADRGRLAAGQVADLILVDGDPSRQISDIRRIHTIIRGDRRFDAAELARAAGLGPANATAAPATSPAGL